MSAMLADQLNRQVPFCHAKEWFFLQAGLGLRGVGDFVNQPPGLSRASREEKEKRGELGKRARAAQGRRSLVILWSLIPLIPVRRGLARDKSPPQGP